MIFFFLSIGLLIPLTIMYRSYRLTKSTDYLYLLAIFVLFPFHWLIGPFPFVALTTLAGRLEIVTLTAFASPFIVLHCLQLRWDKPPKWLFIGLMTFLGAFAITGFVWAFNPAILPTFWFFYEPVRITMSILILYTYTTFEDISGGDPVARQTRILWQIFGLWGIYAAITSFLKYLPNAPEYPYIIDQGALLQNMYMMAMLLYIGIRFPHYLLISKPQVHRACNLYKLVHVYEEEKVFNYLTMQSMRNYVQGLPDSVFGETCADIAQAPMIKTEQEAEVISA